MYTRDDIINNYFIHLLNPEDAGAYDRVEHVEELVRDDPSSAWQIIRILLETAPSEEALGYVAAGPLENLLILHGDAIADQIRVGALGSERVREALSRVLLHPISEVVDRALGDWLHKPLR